MRKRKLNPVQAEPVWPLILRASWQEYAYRIHEAIGLDIRAITDTLTDGDRELLRHRETQQVPVVETYHDSPTVVGTYTTLPIVEEMRR